MNKLDGLTGALQLHRYAARNGNRSVPAAKAAEGDRPAQLGMQQSFVDDVMESWIALDELPDSRIATVQHSQRAVVVRVS